MVEPILRPLDVFTRTLRSRSDLRPAPPPMLVVLTMSAPSPARPAAAFAPVGVDKRDQDAFAQATIGDADAVGRPFAADGLEDGAAGQHEISAVSADARV